MSKTVLEILESSTEHEELAIVRPLEEELKKKSEAEAREPFNKESVLRERAWSMLARQVVGRECLPR